MDPHAVEEVWNVPDRGSHDVAVSAACAHEDRLAPRQGLGVFQVFAGGVGSSATLERQEGHHRRQKLHATWSVGELGQLKYEQLAAFWEDVGGAR